MLGAGGELPHASRTAPANALVRVPTLDLSDVVKSYGTSLVLSSVSVQVAGGEIHALMGENGAGKSTLLKVLSGAIRPDAGTMAISGEHVELQRFNPILARRLGIAIVHQEFSLVPSMTIAENVFLGREPRRGRVLDRKAMEERTDELLHRLRARTSPRTIVEHLGVADAQLVEIAKALAGDVSVLAMDEPSAVLSGVELSTLFEVVQGLAAEGVAVLYVSHRMDEVFELCDRYTVLKDGRDVGSGVIQDTDADTLISLMVGRDVSSVFPTSSVKPGPVRLGLRDLRVEGLSAPVDLEVRTGEIVGIAGLQGSGRSRLAKGIFGEIPATGTIEVDGHAVGPFRSPSRAMAAGIAYLPEDRKEEGLALSKSVRWNASMLLLPKLRGRSRLVSARLEREMAAGIIERLGVKTSSGGGDPVGSLSGGNQQKVVVGKWLELAPAVVIFDEPTRGIDVGAKEQIYRILRDLADGGVAVIIISSELVEVLGLADRVIVMADGSVAGELLGHDATEENVMRLVSAHHTPAVEVAQ